MTWNKLLRFISAIDSRGQFSCCETRKIREKCERDNPTTSGYILLGRYLGYPECCIQAFVEPCKAAKHTPKILRFARKYFCPCKKCGNLIRCNWREQ